MRLVALDTETTGLSPRYGDRITEIGCVEIIDRKLTGNVFHSYVNPMREVSKGALQVTGLTNEFLSKHPPFEDIATRFFEFIQGSTLIIHNAAFDIGFINAEFERVSYTPLNVKDAIDTVMISRKQFPGQPANLDALCGRLGIDLSKRTKHGALIDAELLAEVYIELTGGRQTKIFIEKKSIKLSHISKGEPKEARTFQNYLPNFKKHKEFLENKLKNNLWGYDNLSVTQELQKQVA